MRIEDIIRVALNKAVREYSRGYYASMFVSRNAPRERFLHYLDTSLVFQFWRNVHLIGQKRRPWKKEYVVPSVDKTGLISTLVSRGGYQKQCKSTLETLQANILKTITLVTQNRFTGYVEEV